MNETIKTILARRAIRHFKSEQIKQEELDQILEAGLWAPSAGGRQNPHFLVCQDEEINTRLGIHNRNFFGPALTSNDHDVNPRQISIAEDNSLKNGFYDAPTVVTIFTPEYRFAKNDASIAAQNMMLAAWSLGIGSVHVGRSEETFETEEGRTLMEKAGIPQNYIARVCVCLGYPDGEPGEGRPRKYERIHYVK